MKMLRWGYVHTLLALALLCAAAAPRHADAAIYTASMATHWEIVGFGIPGGPGGGAMPHPDGLIISGLAESSGWSNAIGTGSPSHLEEANVFAVTPTNMLEGDYISQLTEASGSAVAPSGRAESLATSLGQLSFTNGSLLSMTLWIEFSVSYDFLLETEADTILEDAEASVYLHLFEDLSSPQTWLEISQTVRGGVDGSDDDFIQFAIELAPAETRSLFLETSASGFAEYVADNNSGGGGGNNDPNAVPEPSTIAIWSLFGVVGLTVGAVRRRRK